MASYYNFFEDPAMIKLKESLSPEERALREKEGEHIHSIDYDKVSLDEIEQLSNFVLYIDQALRSGLRPKNLYPDEIDVMRRVYGETWFKTKYSFASEND